MRQSPPLIISIFLMLVLMLFNFHCASPEMASARLYIQQQQWHDALRSLENELEMKPDNAEAWFLKGQVHNELGQFDEMIESFDNASALTDEYNEEIQTIRLNNWVTFINAGIEYYNLGFEDEENYYEAIDLFKLATKMEPDSALSYRNIGFAYLVVGEANSAIEPFKKSIALEPDAEVARFLGQIYFDKGYMHWNTYLIEGDESEKHKADDFMENAIEYLLIAIDEDPEDADAVATLSNAYIVLERVDEAKDMFELGIKADPTNKVYHYNLGVLLLQEDKFEEAIYYLGEAIEIDPQYYDALYNIGVAYVNWGVKLREKAVEERKEDDTEFLDMFRKALPYLEAVKDVRMGDAELWEVLGRLYANLDMVVEAEEAFERADRLRERN